MQKLGRSELINSINTSDYNFHRRHRIVLWRQDFFVPKNFLNPFLISENNNENREGKKVPSHADSFFERGHFDGPLFKWRDIYFWKTNRYKHRMYKRY
jgi:hypothetical protein